MNVNKKIKLPGEEETTFFVDIENHIKSSNISVIDAIIEWCSKRNVEIEYVASLVANNASLKARLQIEAEQLNFLKKTIRIPI